MTRKSLKTSSIAMALAIIMISTGCATLKKQNTPPRIPDHIMALLENSHPLTPISIKELLAWGRLENGLNLMSEYLNSGTRTSSPEDKRDITLTDAPNLKATLSRSSFVATSIQLYMDTDTCMDFEQLATENKALKSTQGSIHGDISHLTRYIYNPTSIISLTARRNAPHCLEYISIRDRLPSWEFDHR